MSETSDNKNSADNFGRRWVVVVGAILFVAFLCVLIVIVNKQDAPVVGAAGPEPGASGLSLRNVFGDLSIITSRRTAFIIETLLAGMLGAYLGEIVRMEDVRIRHLKENYRIQFASVIFVGAASSIIVGIIFPLIVFNRFEGPDVNSWTLVAAGGLAANRSRAALSQLEEAISRIISSVEPTFNETRISETVKASVQQAFSAPPVVSYHGKVAVDIRRGAVSVVEGYGREQAAAVQHGGSLALALQFVSDTSERKSDWPFMLSLQINGESDRDPAQFRVLVDFGFPEVAPVERVVDAPVQGASRIEEFPFLVPELPAIVAPSESGAADLREISIRIYQGTRYFDSLIVPVRN